MQDLSTRNYAHIGDAVWELYIREYTIYQTQNSKLLHKITTDRVKMNFQAGLFEFIKPELTDEELEIYWQSVLDDITNSVEFEEFDCSLTTSYDGKIEYMVIEGKIL